MNQLLKKHMWFWSRVAYFRVWWACFTAGPKCRTGHHDPMSGDFKIGVFKYRECFWCGMRHAISKEPMT